MPEHDLTLICQKLPCVVGNDVSTQAHNILEAISGDDVVFDIQSGDQPTLFPGALYLNGKTWSYTVSSANGAFPITSKYYVDDTEVLSSYVFTDNDEGKTFKVIDSSPNFISSSVSAVIDFPIGLQPGYSYGTDNNFELNVANSQTYTVVYIDGIDGKSYLATWEYSFDGGSTWHSMNTSGNNTKIQFFYIMESNHSVHEIIPIHNILVRMNKGSVSGSTYFLLYIRVRYVFCDGSIIDPTNLNKWIYSNTSSADDYFNGAVGAYINNISNAAYTGLVDYTAGKHTSEYCKSYLFSTLAELNQGQNYYRDFPTGWNYFSFVVQWH